MKSRFGARGRKQAKPRSDAILVQYFGPGILRGDLVEHDLCVLRVSGSSLFAASR